MSGGEGRGASGTNGASPGTPEPLGARRRREELAYRGIRWRRSAGGTVTWLNERRGQWVAWYEGADAPPLPPAWEAQAHLPDYPVKAPAASSAPALVDLLPPRRGAARPRAAGRPSPVDRPVPRASWRSPYRLAPIAIALAIVAAGIWQGTHPALTATPQQVAKAKSLRGKCLAQTGGSAKAPQLSPIAVSCSSPQAAYRVVEVLVPGAKGEPRACPTGDAMVRVEDTNVAGEPVECVAPVRHVR